MSGVETFRPIEVPSSGILSLAAEVEPTQRAGRLLALLGFEVADPSAAIDQAAAIATKSIVEQNGFITGEEVVALELVRGYMQGQPVPEAEQQRLQPLFRWFMVQWLLGREAAEPEPVVGVDGAAPPTEESPTPTRLSPSEFDEKRRQPPLAKATPSPLQEAAFNAAFDRLRRIACGVVRTLMKDETLLQKRGLGVDDVAAEVVSRLYEYPHLYDPAHEAYYPEGLSKWLWKTAEHFLTDQWRRYNVRRDVEGIWNPEGEERAPIITYSEHGFAAAEARAILGRALPNLTQDAKDVLVLLTDLAQGHTWEEVAKRHNLKDGTARSKIHRGRKLVIKELEDLGLADGLRELWGSTP